MLNTPASSGRWAAAAIRPRATAARLAGSAPPRLSSWNSKPEPLPRPEIGGRLKAKASAAGTWVKRALASSSAANTDRPAALRSSNGFSTTTTMERLESAMLSSRL